MLNEGGRLPIPTGACGAGAKYLGYWPDLASRWRSWLTSIEIAAAVEICEEIRLAVVASYNDVIQAARDVELGLARHPCLHWFRIGFRRYYT